MFTLSHAPAVRHHDTAVRPSFNASRVIIGLVVAAVALVGVVRTFDPVTLSLPQLFWLALTVAGVALATRYRP